MAEAQIVENLPISEPLQAKIDSLSAPSFFDSVANVFTGNLDYQRELAATQYANEVSAYNASKATEASRQLAREQRAWEETMSNTAYSRAIADLKRNGINPYAIGSYSPSSTPSGSSGTAYVASSNSFNPPNIGANAFNMLVKLIELGSRVAMKAAGM